MPMTATGARESSTDRNTVTKFNEGDKVRVTGGYIVEGGMVPVGHEDTIRIVWEEEHVHEVTGDVVDCYELGDIGFFATDDELELIQ